MAVASLKKRLENNELILCGGVWDSLAARVEEDAGFDAVKLGSSQVAFSIGVPDIGLTTPQEMCNRASNICSNIEIPLMVDFESGFGGEGDIANAVYWAREMERVGVTAIHIDDYGDDKCPFLPPYIPKLMSAESIADKIKAICDHRRSENFLIMVRSGATASSGFRDREEAYQESIRRFLMWKEAGADIVWPRTYSHEHLVRARKDIPGILSQDVASNVGQGRTGAAGDEPSHTGEYLYSQGYNLLTLSASLQAVIVKALADASELMVKSRGDPSTIDAMSMPFKRWIEYAHFSEWIKLNKY